MDFTKFRKPSNASCATMHLYVASGGVVPELLVDVLRTEISGGYLIGGGEDSSSYAIHCCQPPVDERKRCPGHIYLSFQSNEMAIAAKDALLKPEVCQKLGLPCKRRLRVEFAELLLPPSLQPHIPECTSLSSSVVVPDLVLVDDFLSEEEERSLIGFIDSQPWNDGINTRTSPSSESQQDEQEQLFSVSRRVQHYGFAFNYKTRNIDPELPLGELPEPIVELVLRRIKERKLLSMDFNQITVNEYLPGQGISSHVDTHSAFEDAIVSLSLCGSLVMDFTKVNSDPHESTISKQLVLSRRSLLIMMGESRYQWTHGIAYRKTDKVNGVIVPRTRRVSLTIRRIRTSPCDCKYKHCCDSQSS